MNSFLLALYLIAADPVVDPGIAAAASHIQAEAGAHRLILLGEMHGTREAPRLASALVASYAAKEAVTLALELSSTLNPALEEYIVSDGGPKAREELLAWPYWRVEAQRSDGRRNLELIALLEDMRQLRAGGAYVYVVGFDIPPVVAPGGPSRDEAMAQNLRLEFASMAKGRVVSVSGNAHAMLARPSYAPPEMSQPMGSFLADLDPFSVDIVARGGTYWVCRPGMEKCGPAEVAEGYMFSERLADGDVFDLRVVLPSYSLAPLIPAEGASPAAQAEEFLRLAASEQWLEDTGDEWLAQLPVDSRIAIAELAMKSADPVVRTYGPMQYYAMGMDERGDAAIAELALDGVEIGGFAWGWLHSGEAKLLQRRLEGIRRVMLARYATLTPEQRKRADKFMCEDDKPCASAEQSTR